MATNVPIFPPKPDGTAPRTVGIATAAPVRGTKQWVSMGKLANYVGGRGSTLVATNNPRATIPLDGNTHTFRYYVWQSAQTARRIWVVWLEWDTAGAGYIDFTNNPTISLNGATADEVRVTWGADDGAFYAGFVPVILVEDITSPSGGEQEVTIAITNVVGSQTDIAVRGIACYEMPRPEIEQGTTEYGVDWSTSLPGQPIQEQTAASTLGQSVGGVRAFVANRLDEAGRRCALFHWAVDTSQAFTGAGTAMFDNEDEMPLLARNRLPTDTTRTVTAAVYVRASDGTTDGNIVLTTTGSGNSVSLPVSGTSWGWVTGTLDVDAEDLSASDGRRSSRFDQIDVVLARANGTGTLQVAGISIGEHEL